MRPNRCSMKQTVSVRRCNRLQFIDAGKCRSRRKISPAKSIADIVQSAGVFRCQVRGPSGVVLQQINVERGRADFEQAGLRLDVARMAVTRLC